MTAGRGIVHSERSPERVREIENTLHAIQTWVALPEESEETEPCFSHHPSNTIPVWEDNGVNITLIAGETMVDILTCPKSAGILGYWRR